MMSLFYLGIAIMYAFDIIPTYTLRSNMEVTLLMTCLSFLSYVSATCTKRTNMLKTIRIYLNMLKE